jgi:hypothetical protein
MLSIRIYERQAANSPGMLFVGRKSWEPGKALEVDLRQGSVGAEIRTRRIQRAEEY